MLSSSYSLRMKDKDRLALFLARYWWLLFGFIYGVFVLAPFLAPVFMQLGWEAAGNGIYWFYSWWCHQLPERSFFLFGPQGMYSLAQVQAAWQNTIDPMVLRHFIGSAELGWKVAWSDRMVSMYTSIWIFGLSWGFLRKKTRQLPLWGFLLLALPMAIDGTTHLISDFAGIDQGFRYSNEWLAALTNHQFSAAFYYGDALGSFNSWMRLITGILFGLGLVLFGFPYVQAALTSAEQLVLSKYQARQQILLHAFHATNQEVSDSNSSSRHR